MTDIRVILAEGHTMVRECLALSLDRTPGLRVVAQAGDGVQALRLAADPGADVLVLDYGLPELDGPAVTRRLLAEHEDLAVVILTVHDNVHSALKARAAGALGFCVKSDGLTELVAAIRAVHEGREYVAPALVEPLAQRHSATRCRTTGVDGLSRREFELLCLLGLGHSLGEVAKAMKISDSTASTYRMRMMAKLGLQSTAQVIRYAVQNGLTA